MPKCFERIYESHEIFYVLVRNPPAALSPLTFGGNHLSEDVETWPDLILSLTFEYFYFEASFITGFVNLCILEGSLQLRMASSSSGTANASPASTASMSWNSNFIGRKMVSGATLNDVGLSLVVADLRKAKTNDDSVRCNVEFGDRKVFS